MKIKTLALPTLLLCLALLLVSCSGENSRAIRTGDTIAPFSGTDLEGTPFSLGAHAGKPAIVRFFLLDCPYCKADTPVFNAFYEKYRERGLAVVYINNNGANAEEVKAFADDLNITFPVIFDPGAKIAKQYNVKVQPLTLVLSPEHKLLAALLGGVSEAELDELLSPSLQ